MCHNCHIHPSDNERNGAQEEQINSESNKKGKRSRTAFSEAQLDELELEFHKEKYPGAQTREKISKRLNIKEDRIQVCISNSK